MTNGEVLRVRAAMKPISHRAAGAGHRRRRHRRAGRRRSTSAATCARCRPPAWSPRRWSRWCWPTPSLEKFGGDSVAETRRNVQAYLDAPGRSGERRRCVVLVGPPGVGQDHGRPAARGARSACRSGTPTPTSRPRPASRSPTSSSTTARRTSGRWSERRSRARWPSTTACSRWAAARSLSPATRELLVATAGRPWSLARRRPGRRPPSGSGSSRDRPLLAVNPRAMLRTMLETRAPLYREVATLTVPHRGRDPGRRGRRHRRRVQPAEAAR